MCFPMGARDRAHCVRLECPMCPCFLSFRSEACTGNSWRSGGDGGWSVEKRVSVLVRMLTFGLEYVHACMLPRLISFDRKNLPHSASCGRSSLS